MTSSKIKEHTKKKKKYNAADRIALLDEQKLQLPQLKPSDIKQFTDLPLSKSTLKGLKCCGYVEPTKIQKQCLQQALLGLDVVGESKTGTGKTLAFIIPILESLYSKFWIKDYGVGCIIVTPRRELAYQIFEETRKVGQFHNFSAGLVIGGKDWLHEQKLVGKCNILICTPGRIVQHLTENPNFSADNVQMLIIDEADECLSAENNDTMDVIFNNLPTERQTLIFSATQIRKMNDLSRAVCKDFVFCSAHEFSKSATPASLSEEYVICNHEDKLKLLWQFLKTHQNEKILVFVSTHKQVRFITNLFTVLRCKANLLNLSGGMKELDRIKAYDDFNKATSATLICTDAVGRGLDFQSVNRVLQLDCPENHIAYIHRVGRAARQGQAGKSILFLTPDQEKPMVDMLTENKVSIKKIECDKPNAIHGLKDSVLMQKVLHEQAKRVFRTYIKSCLLLKPELRSVKNMNFVAYARSLGLEDTPQCDELNYARRVKQLADESVYSTDQNSKPKLAPSNTQPKLTVQTVISEPKASSSKVTKHIFFSNNEEVKEKVTGGCCVLAEFLNANRARAQQMYMEKMEKKEESKPSNPDQVYQCFSDDGSDEEDSTYVNQKFIDDLPDPDLLYPNDNQESEEKSKKKKRKRTDKNDSLKKKKRKKIDDEA